MPSRAYPKDVGGLGMREGKGGLLTTSARFTTDLAKLLVRTTDCRICSNWEKSGWRARLLPAPPPCVTPSLGTYQLMVIDHDQLHILGFTVHCRVAPADLEGGVGTWNQSPTCLASWPKHG